MGITTSSWIRIDRNTFNVVEASVQLSMGSHAIIYISIDILNNPTYSQFFIKLYESGKKFDLIANKFVGIGSHITQIDIDFNNIINISIRSDLLETKNTQERRDEMIDDILNGEDKL